MTQALGLARLAAQRGEIPIGAVVVFQGEIVGEGANLRESSGDPTAHAEVLALRSAAERMGDWRLSDCELFVTLEPCVMCAGAIVAARVRRLVFGAWDPLAGACGSAYNVVEDPRLNHACLVVRGVLADECAQVLQDAFRELRLRD